MADIVEETEDRPDHFDSDRRFLVRIKRGKMWANGYGPSEKTAQINAKAKLDSLPRGYVGKFS